MRSPAKNTGPFPAARSRIGSEMTLLCRSEAIVIARPALDRRAPGGRGDQPGEADELRVELLVERRAGAPHGGDGVERARDVGAVGVVLRLVDLAARREQHDEPDADRQRGRDRRGDRVAQPRAGAVADRERGQQAEREARRTPTTPISVRR